MNNRTEFSFDELCPFIREAGLQHRDAWRNRTRRIYDHQFMYCFKGTANAIIGKEQYKIKKGDLIIFSPNTPHQLWFDEDTSGEFYWFHCDFFYYDDKDWIYDYYQNAETYIMLFGHHLVHREHIRANPIFNGGYQLPKYLQVPQVNEIEYLFRKIVKAYVNQEPYWQINAKIYFLDIMKQILSLTNVSPLENEHYVSATMKNYMHHNYYQKLTADEICRDTGLNTEYAYRLFRKETGQKVTDYLNRYRIQQAKKLFLEMDLNLIDISEMVGFNNENYFSSVFKKYEGKTPAKSREDILAVFNDLNA
ncbi:AraC family transcriptional regulator [Vallitaleaceae bacterium 9-2]